MESLGAVLLPDHRCRFVAWAPAVPHLSLVVGLDRKQVVPMNFHCGFHTAEIDAPAGTRYLFRFPDGRELPDPASRFQPDGIHAASEVVDTRAFRWTDSAFKGHALRDLIIYELHVGTFTADGTFAGAISRLDALVDLGITAVELMPVAQFPGRRNWGYDGAYPFAVQNSYGGPAGLQQFVDAAHARGLSVVLDVVYNHLGPEGNYLGAFGPFFTDRYHTPWGQAVNFDEADSDPVRNFFVQNALYWLEEFHIDALRLDAVHGIFDFSAHHILAEIAERVSTLSARLQRPLHVIAESDLNDSRLLHSPDRGGYALDAQWTDDFHHSLHTLLTHETAGYYQDFGSLEDLCVVFREGWRYSGQHSRYRRRVHGNSPAGIPNERFVVFSQNHDQVGNRALGDRLAQITDFESIKLAAGVTLLAPFVPLLFMGEEYGETRPFLYFTSHTDPALADAVRRGRRAEFAAFGWTGEIPDPQDEATFRRCILDYEQRHREPHATIWALYKRLISLRKKFALAGQKPDVRCDAAHHTLTLSYRSAVSSLAAVFYFGDEPARISLQPGIGECSLILNSSEFSATNALARPASVALDNFPFERRSFLVFASNSEAAE
ncbi:MAG TPA: malto-oligosyltrehalose trehalohydrolase [Candidatus Limnocylindrales bacterium]|nr:malto-oligosyltrehalose trehalohydrolase [Candidatus Limnocylindrales bacterium]